LPCDAFVFAAPASLLLLPAGDALPTQSFTSLIAPLQLKHYFSHPTKKYSQKLLFRLVAQP
jgi:hypothetical protein